MPVTARLGTRGSMLGNIELGYAGGVRILSDHPTMLELYQKRSTMNLRVYESNLNLVGRNTSLGIFPRKSTLELD